MSPPKRILDEPDSQRADDAPARAVETPAAPTAVGSAEAAILATQRAAGNQAVAAVLGGGGRGVQRAPNDDDPRRVSGMAHAPTLDPRPGPAPNVSSSEAVAPTLPPAAPLQVSSSTMSSSAPAPGSPAGLQVSSSTMSSSAPAPGPARGSEGGGSGGSAAAPTPPGGALFPYRPQWWQSDPRFAVGGEYGPRAVPPGMYGGRAKPVSVDPTPIPVNPGLVESAYRHDPSRVIRSPNTTWHEEAWDKSKGPATHGGETPAPKAFSDGRFYYVAPDYEGSATTLPGYAAVGNVGLGAPGSAPAGGSSGAAGGGAAGGAATPRVLETHGPATDRLRQAVAPETPFSGPRGTQKAAPATFSEVATALAKDPSKVVRSPNAGWHRQGYRLDGGGREAPGAFKVGDLYVVAPDYPIKGVPPLGQAVPQAPSALPQAAQSVALPGTTHSEGSTLKSYSATTTERAGRTVTRTRSREQGVVTTATEVSEGGITNRQEKQRGVGFGVGGNLIGATAGTTDTSRIDGDVVAAKKSTQVTGGLTSDMKLGGELKSTKELVTGTDPEGNPVKTATATKVGAKVDLDSVSLTAGRETTSQRGTTRGFGAGVKADKKGNAELELNYNIATRGGVSFKPTVSRGVKVEASDPIPVEGGWEVTYRVADTTGAGLGGGKQLGGGATVGVNVGASEAEFQGGKRTFKTEDEAKEFRDNAASRVANERIFAPSLAPTTVAGALQIPVGETRTSGDISGRSIGASAGHSGVALNVGKSTSSTREVAVKRTGDTTVEVTGSVAGSKTGSVGISAPVVSHGYSSTNTTSFAITFEFDLSKEQGRAAFELYCRTGWPPPQVPKLIEKAGSDSDHDTVTIPGLGSAVWTGSTWQVTRETADGSTTKVYGGAQTHEQKPGTVGKLLGEDTLKSNAQILRVVQDGEEVGARAQLTVGGSSGDYNRGEFGKIFTGARTDSDTKPSGEWTLSAPVPKERIRDLERSSKRIRSALDEREAYSELVKEGGAQMLGGQVGLTSKDWDLELKGDPNFPGEKERVRLKQLRKSLMARVRSNPEIANDIVRETGDELAQLARRRDAVADQKRYTDLPDGLRQQQLGVIDTHIDDMKVVRRTAQAVAMKRNPTEKSADVAARLDREEKAGPGSRARTSAGATEPSKTDAEYAKLQDQVSAKESRIAAKRNEIREHSIALGDAIGAKGTTALKANVDSHVAQVQVGIGKAYINLATEADRRQAALEQQIEDARNGWSAAADPKDQLAATRTLEKLLDERLKLMEVTLFNIREAGKAVFHITTRAARSGNPAFWSSLGETEGED